MRIRSLLAASLPFFFVLALAATPVLAGSDSDSGSGSSGFSGFSGGSDSNSGPAQAVPEPTALLAFGLGAAGVAYSVRRRKNR